MPRPASPTSPDTADHPAPHRHAVRLRALWFGLFGAHVMWSVQLLVGYGIAARACYPGRVPLPRPGSGALWAVEAALSALALAVAAGALAVAYRSWRATGGEAEGERDVLLEVGEGRTRFMAFAGVLASGVFLLAIALNAAAIFLTPACW